MDYLTIQEVSAILKVHSNTVYKMCRQGVLPAVKIGKEWRFRRTILDEWINTSIHLSGAGFDLMLDRSWLQIKRAGVAAEVSNK